MLSKKVVVIGAGASGLIASGFAAENGAKVTLIEKNKRVGRKIMITGKGRCNVTNNCDVQNFIRNVPINGRFLYSALNGFTPQDAMDFFKQLGLPLKTERGNRVFPMSDKAVDVVDALHDFVLDKGCKIVCDSAVSLIIENNEIIGVKCENETYYADSVIICCGGKSYPLTGSTGDGYTLARSVGHTITPLKPSLVPLVCPNNFIPRLQGLSLKNIEITLFEEEKAIYSDFGEMIFTHYGVSGPVILSASSHIKNMGKKSYKIKIDLKPALDFHTLDKRVCRDFEEFANKDFVNSLSKLLPNKLIPVIVSLSGIKSGEKVNQITRERRLKLVDLIKNFYVTVSDFRPIDEAIVTSGGVNVKEINPKTMCSKIIDNLYFAGEIIDVDAYTGGFNLQIAFSTAVLCADNM